jgi:NADPH:quinone reductase-like Zn-dependent oxidoreductase
LKAVICTKYGGPSVLKLQSVAKPTISANEVLIKIVCSSATRADTMMREGTPLFGRLFMGLRKPKYPITGTGFSGTIEDVGEKVSAFKKGDVVMGESIFGSGTNAEYVAMSEDAVLVQKPENISFEQAAAICDGALTSLNFLQEIAKLQAQQSILIYGASGSLGTAAVQLAKHFNAEVTALCSTENIALVKSLGADHVIDYKHQDFTKLSQRYDVIYDTVGLLSFTQCKDSLEKKGQFISPVLSCSLLMQVLWTKFFTNKKAKFSATGIKATAELVTLLRELKVLIEQNKLHSVIDKVYQLEDIAEAHRYIDKGHKKGNVVISVS